MPLSRLKGPFWVHRGSTRVDLARRWLDEQTELGHQVPTTSAELARAVGVDRRTARKALRLPPIPYTGNGEMQIDRDMVPLRISPTAKILWTLIRRLAPAGEECPLSEGAMAAAIGIERDSVRRALQTLHRLGHLTRTKQATRGGRTYVNWGWVKPPPINVQNHPQTVGKTTPKEVGKTTPLGAVQKGSLQPRGLLDLGIDVTDPSKMPEWARQTGGGRSLPIWRLLPCTAVISNLPDPVPADWTCGLLRDAGVRLWYQIGPRLAAAGIRPSELKALFEHVRDREDVRSRPGLLAGVCKVWLAERKALG